ncbi:MAG: hypothetical protein VW683_00175 [Betaproteobacteria bacterium]|jgi:hypothetical protein
MTMTLLALLAGFCISILITITTALLVIGYINQKTIQYQEHLNDLKIDVKKTILYSEFFKLSLDQQREVLETGLDTVSESLDHVAEYFEAHVNENMFGPELDSRNPMHPNNFFRPPRDEMGMGDEDHEMPEFPFSEPPKFRNLRERLDSNKSDDVPLTDKDVDKLKDLFSTDEDTK